VSEKAEVFLGTAFDIKAERKRTDHRKLGRNKNSDSFEIVIRNHKSEKAKLVISEERLRVATDHLEGVIWAVDSNLRFTLSRGKGLAALGLKPDQVVGMTVYELYKTTDPEFPPIAQHRRALAGEIVEVQSVRDGVTLSSIFRPIKNDIGEITGVLGLALDITERKRLEEQLHQSEKMQAIGELAGGVAHDFNNQLSVILSSAEFIKGEIEENSTSALLINNIITGAERSADLTKKLLAFARKGKYVTTTVDIEKIIFEVVSMLKHSVDKKIKISQYLNADPSTVSGDLSQLQNAVLNITLNSRDAMPKGGELNISTDLVSIGKRYIEKKNLEIKPGEYLKVSITDNGIGMDPKTLKRIYEPFFTTKETGKGTGMGLASVFGTIKNHHGAIEVESKQGSGTTTVIFLPSVTTPAVKLDNNITIPTKAEGQILIVDDEELIVEPLQLLLTKKGYKAIACENGIEAVKIYKESWKKIDMVLLDVVMPEMDGQETFQAMKEINPDVKVLLLSGFSIEGKAKEIIKDGALGFLQKPVNANGLFIKMAEVLNH